MNDHTACTLAKVTAESSSFTAPVHTSSVLARNVMHDTHQASALAAPVLNTGSTYVATAIGTLQACATHSHRDSNQVSAGDMQ